MARPSGALIAIEGIDGAGTSTQTARLVERLRDAGHAVQATREPSDGEIGKLIRRRLAQIATPPDPALMALLFAADRIDHLHAEIAPALAAGTHVVSDRYLLSSLAYQSVRVKPNWVMSINREARPPDLTLLIDVPAGVAAARRQQRAEAPEIYDADETQRRVAAHYRAFAALLPEQRVVTVDGAASIDVVADAVAAEVFGLLESWA